MAETPQPADAAGVYAHLCRHPGAWIRDGRSGLCGICVSSTELLVVARTPGGTCFRTRLLDVEILETEVAVAALYTPPVGPFTSG